MWDVSKEAAPRNVFLALNAYINAMLQVNNLSS